MSATYNLFCRWRDMKGFKSDNQASLHLGLPRQTIQNWKEGRNGEPEYIVKMCNDLGENPTKVVLEAYAEQKKGDSAKVLIKLSKQFGLMAILILYSAVSPQSAQAHDSDHFAYSAKRIYIM